MTRIDGTQYLRQMMFMPNLLPLCGVLLAFMFYFVSYWGAPFHRGCHHPFYTLPETMNGQMVPYDCLPTVYIEMNGEMNLGDDRNIDLSESSLRLEDDIEEKKSPDRRVLLKVDQNVPFGKVQEALKWIQKADVKNISLISKERAAYFEFR